MTGVVATAPREAGTEPPGARTRSRLLAFDLARSFAIVMMVLINFQLMLAMRPADGDDAFSRALRWLVHVPSGRASSLFVVLAGTGISLLTREARHATGPDRWRTRLLATRILLLRAVFLLFAGLLLYQVWWIDILHFYACYLLIAALVLWWVPDALLVVAYITVVIAGAAIHVLDLPLPDLPLLSPQGFAIDALLDGVHPVIPWLAFVIYGLWLGRRDLSQPALRRRIALWAGALFVTIELGALLLTTLVLCVPALAPMVPHLDLLGTGWSPDPLYVISASCTATLFIVLAHELMDIPRVAGHHITRAFISAGQLALSIYITHAVIGVHLPRVLLGWRQSLPVEAVTAYWFCFCVVIILGAAIWRRFVSRGPLELVMRLLTSWRLPKEKSLLADAVEPKLTPPLPRWTRALALVIALLAATLVLLRITGVPVSATLDDDSRLGALSLLGQRQTHELVLTEPTLVVIETHSGLDLYLELDLMGGDTPTRIVEDDDSGEGTEARITRRLDPGTYRITVRPYGATTGPYRLSIVRNRLP